jgi:hypothetical protein
MQQMLKVLKVNKTGKKYYSRKVVKKNIVLVSTLGEMK